MARNIIAGIDAGSSSVRVIIAEQKKDGGLSILGASQKQSEGIRRGYITNIEDAAKSIKGAVKATEKMSGLPVKRAVVAIGGIGLGSLKSKGSVMISRADGEVTDYDIRRAVDQSEANLSNLANRKIIHSIPLHFKIDNSPVLGRASGMTGGKLEVETLFVTCLNQHLNDLIKAVEMAGVAVDDVMASPLAMSQAILSKTQKEVGCVLANIGAATVSLVVFEEGLPISLEVFPLGSDYITNDIALGLQVTLDEAEKLKIDFSNASGTLSSKRKLSDIIEARLNDIFELVEGHLKKINREEMLPGGIVLTGGGSNLYSLEEIAKDYLRLPAKIGIFSPRKDFSLKNVTAPSGNMREQIFNDPGWSTALGLCLLNSGENSFEVAGEKNSRKGISSSLKNWFRSLLP